MRSIVQLYLGPPSQVKSERFEVRGKKLETSNWICGDVAQRESTCLARRGSAVQIRSSPPERDGDLTAKIPKSV